MTRPCSKPMLDVLATARSKEQQRVEKGETMSEKPFKPEDSPICAKCHRPVTVAYDLEWNDGDLCYTCLADEYPELLRQHAEQAKTIKQLNSTVDGLTNDVDALETGRQAVLDYYAKLSAKYQEQDKTIADLQSNLALRRAEIARLNEELRQAADTAHDWQTRALRQAERIRELEAKLPSLPDQIRIGDTVTLTGEVCGFDADYLTIDLKCPETYEHVAHVLGYANREALLKSLGCPHTHDNDPAQAVEKEE